MPDELRTTVIAQGGFEHLREMQTLFREAGLESEIVRPPAEQCSS
jgi:hypothetical protein